MPDIPLEVIRAIITGSICVYLYVVGKNEDIHHQKGWSLIIAGFGLIFFGTLIDISDNFESLNKFVIIGDTEYEAFLEKVVGYLAGSLLLAIGLVKWVPFVVELKRAQKELKESRDELEVKVKERTFDLQTINKRLEGEIKERRSTEELLRKFSHAVEQGASSVIITDTDGTIEYVNPQFTRITGYTSEEAVGQNPRILQSGNHTEEFYKDLWDTITSGRVWRGELHNIKKNGELFWELGSISPIRNSEGTITHFIALKEDITERKAMEDQLRTTATRDKLTGAYNRVRFEELIDIEMERSTRYDHPLSMLIVDIDGFKNVNDTCGHLAGDYVLKSVADILSSHMRKTNHLIRWGGDEFIIVPVETDIDGSNIFSERLRKAIESFDFGAAGKITVSIGIARFHKGDTEDTFLKRADDALYKAKEAGGNRVEAVQ